MNDDVTGVDPKYVQQQIDFYTKKYPFVGELKEKCS